MSLFAPVCFVHTHLFPPVLPYRGPRVGHSNTAWSRETNTPPLSLNRCLVRPDRRQLRREPRVHGGAKDLIPGPLPDRRARQVHRGPGQRPLGKLLQGR